MGGVLAIAIMLAVVLEALIEYVKDIVRKDFAVEKGIAIAVGLVFAFGAGLDIFELAGIEFRYPYVGTVIMGLFLSKGANWLHDFFDKLLKEKN